MNALLRAYGYHWKRTNELTEAQYNLFHALLADAIFDDNLNEEPKWVLITPLDTPVRSGTILRWLGKHSATSDEVHSFLHEHEFTTLDKDEKNVWRIQTPGGEIVPLKRALEMLEQIRIDETARREQERKQQTQEIFDKSIAQLKEMLDLYGTAMNEKDAWGYSPRPTAERLTDGTIKVTTYHLEDEWLTDIYKTEAEVVYELYTDDEGVWTPGEWVKVR